MAVHRFAGRSAVRGAVPPDRNQHPRRTSVARRRPLRSPRTTVPGVPYPSSTPRMNSAMAVVAALGYSTRTTCPAGPRTVQSIVLAHADDAPRVSRGCLCRESRVLGVPHFAACWATRGTTTKALLRTTAADFCRCRDDCAGLGVDAGPRARRSRRPSSRLTGFDSWARSRWDSTCAMSQYRVVLRHRSRSGADGTVCHPANQEER